MLHHPYLPVRVRSLNGGWLVSMPSAAALQLSDRTAASTARRTAASASPKAMGGSGARCVPVSACRTEFAICLMSFNFRPSTVSLLGSKPNQQLDFGELC